MSVDKVSRRAVVARVELGEPLALAVLGHAAPHFVRVGPEHGCVVANGFAEFEGLDPFVAEESDLFIPIRDCPRPVGGGRFDALLVNVKVLSDVESADLPAF